MGILGRPSSPRLAATILIVAGFVVYANSFTAPFVFDDSTAISLNASITRLLPLRNAFRGPQDSPAGGRPVANLSFAINYALGGLAPRGYHAWNLGVHVLAAIVLFAVIRRSCTTMDDDARYWIAFSSALIWLVHPLQSEVVDYVSQRTESMMGLCYLLTIYASIRAFSVDDRTRRWYLLAVVCCALGMGAKESMVTAPVAVLLYDWAFYSPSIGNALRRRTVFYLGLFSTWIVLAVLMTRPSHATMRTALPSWRSAWAYLVNQLPMLSTYMKLIVWPHPLLLDYGPPRQVSFISVLPSAALVAGVALLTVMVWRRSRPLGFLGVWFFLTLAPTSSIWPMVTEVGAERRMYLPLAAAVTAGVLTAGFVFGRIGRSAGQRSLLSFLPGLSLVVVVGVLSVVTSRRNAEYGNPVELWREVVNARPTARAHYNLALALKDAGLRQEAAAEFRESESEDPELKDDEPPAR